MIRLDVKTLGLLKELYKRYKGEKITTFNSYNALADEFFRKAYNEVDRERISEISDALETRIKKSLKMDIFDNLYIGARQDGMILDFETDLRVKSNYILNMHLETHDECARITPNKMCASSWPKHLDGDLYIDIRKDHLQISSLQDDLLYDNKDDTYQKSQLWADVAFNITRIHQEFSHELEKEIDCVLNLSAQSKLLYFKSTRVTNILRKYIYPSGRRAAINRDFIIFIEVDEFP